MRAGHVAVWARAQGVEYAPGRFETGTGRVEMVRFVENLTFTVPPGYYPDGVSISMRGHMGGTIDFNDGIRITTFAVPPEVTWTSESGVFLADLSDVPEPVAMLRLEQNHPNPFNPATVITFTLAEDMPARLRVFDLAGRLVATLVDIERLGDGPYRVPWAGRDTQGQRVAAGVYLYRLESGGQTVTKRMVLVR